MSWIDLALTISGLPTLAASCYLTALAALARRQKPAAAPLTRLRFDVVVPAHDEEVEIGGTVASLVAIDYPRELFRVLVIADNCTDRTAERAAAAGAQVLVRNDPKHRGKGYALAHAFNQSLAESFADVVVVVDADTAVSSNLLTAFAARFEAGAVAVQADYGVRNPLSSWRTRVMTIALAAFHGEVGGTDASVIMQAPRQQRRFRRRSGVRFCLFHCEDLEYGLALSYAGIRVA